MTDEQVLVAPVETDAASSTADVETSTSEAEVSQGTEDTQQDTAQETSVDEGAETEGTEGDEAESSESKDEEDLSEFTGSAAARFREMCKAAPGLEQLLAKFPKAKDAIAATFRRDAALRDRNITIAEIDEYRSRCVNGLQDLDAMQRSLQEANQLDSAFFTKDREGNYPGHSDFISNLAKEDKAATIALLRRAPRDFAQLDPEGYSDTFGAIMQSTFAKDRVADIAADMYDAAKAAKDNVGMERAARLWNYFNGFGKKAEAQDPEAQKLRAQLAERDKGDEARRTEDGKRFSQSVISDAVSRHRKVVNEHDLIKKLPQEIPASKKAMIVDRICKAVEDHLGRSYSFNRDITTAFMNMDAKTWHSVDEKGWQPWLLNMYVRRILNEETPGLIQGNRVAAARKKAAGARGGIATRRPTTQPSPAGNGKQRTNPSDYSLDEIMSGKVPESVLDAYMAKRGR